MSVLLLDVGNTSVSFCAFSRGGLGNVRRAPSHPESDAGWEEAFAGVWDGLDAAVLASVNPSASARMAQWIRASRAGLPVLAAGKDFPVPVENRARNPREVGVDRLLNVLAAHARCARAAIVVDLGTAATFDLVSAEGAYLGGAIAPGLSLCFGALHEGTALLPRAFPQEPAEPIGRDTLSCLHLGVVEGYRGLVAHLVARFRRELGEDAPVLFTGGEAAWVAKTVAGAEVVPELTLDGLRLAYAQWGKVLPGKSARRG